MFPPLCQGSGCSRQGNVPLAPGRPWCSALDHPPRLLTFGGSLEPAAEFELQRLGRVVGANGIQLLEMLRQTMAHQSPLQRGRGSGESLVPSRTTVSAQTDSPVHGLTAQRVPASSCMRRELAMRSTSRAVRRSTSAQASTASLATPSASRGSPASRRAKPCTRAGNSASG